MSRMCLLQILFFGISHPALDANEPFLPAKIARCLEDPKVSASVKVDETMNPFYLRGDFDGDGVPDFAVAVRNSKSMKNGVLVCRGRGMPVLLGADSIGAKPFSDMPNDDFVAPSWTVATVGEILEYRKTIKDAPIPKGESVKMIWEDGIHYIYWNGVRFLWSPLIQ